MDHSALVNTYAFLFFFSLAYLLGGKRPVLRISTRVVLVALFGLGLWYAFSMGEPYHDLLGIATLIVNGLFAIFGVLDYLAFRRNVAG